MSDIPGQEPDEADDDAGLRGIADQFDEAAFASSYIEDRRVLESELARVFEQIRDELRGSGSGPHGLR